MFYNWHQKMRLVIRNTLAKDLAKSVHMVWSCGIFKFQSFSTTIYNVMQLQHNERRRRATSGKMSAGRRKITNF